VDEVRPVARTSGLRTEQVDDELVVFDTSRDLFFRLNRSAATVWGSSDGSRTVADLVAVLTEHVGELADEDLVLVTLDRLQESELIESGYLPRDPRQETLSRRRFMRRAGTVGAAVVAALPVVQAVVAPTPAMAQSAGMPPNPTTPPPPTQTPPPTTLASPHP
jgi:hypothetical protein